MKRQKLKARSADAIIPGSDFSPSLDSVAPKQGNAEPRAEAVKETTETIVDKKIEPVFDISVGPIMPGDVDYSALCQKTAAFGGDLNDMVALAARVENLTISSYLMLCVMAVALDSERSIEAAMDYMAFQDSRPSSRPSRNMSTSKRFVKNVLDVLADKRFNGNKNGCMAACAYYITQASDRSELLKKAIEASFENGYSIARKATNSSSFRL